MTSRVSQSHRRALVAVFAALLTVGSLTGCGTPNKAEDSRKKETYQLVWPEPPNEPRFIFDGQLRNESDIQPETDESRLRRLLSGRESRSTQPAYMKPGAIAARNGRVYVADHPSSSVVVFDIPRRKIFQMAVREPNRVKSPIAIAADTTGLVYVLDSAFKKVMVYDSLGLFAFSVGNKNDLVKPAGVAVTPDGSRIYVVDRGSVENDDHKVIAYAPDGRELFRIGPRGSENGQLNIPLAATVTPDGRLHVLDSGNFRVQTFDEMGKFISSFGSVGNALGHFSRPRSITSDPEGNLYVSDASFNNVQIFTPAGKLLMWLGNAGLNNLPSQFALIGGVAVDETGRLYVADQYHLKIEAFRRSAPIQSQD